MKIELQFPYSLDWETGYLIHHKQQGRKYIVLCKNSSRIKSTTQYARYLLAVKEGRYLADVEEADHIDGNKRNDDISNLQILTKVENSRKYAKSIVHKHGSRFLVVSGCKCEKCSETRRRWSRGWYELHRDEYNSRRRMKRLQNKVAGSNPALPTKITTRKE